MIKRIFCLFVCLVVFSGSVLPALAAQQRVYDEADLLTAQEEEALGESISQLREQAPLDLVVVTTTSTGGKDAQAYADDFFDEGGFGVGEENSGVLLLIDMGASEVAISTTGYGIQLLSDARIDLILDAVIEQLAVGESAQAAEAFIKRVGAYASQDVSQSGTGGQTGGQTTVQTAAKPWGRLWKALAEAIPVSLIVGALAVWVTYLACGRSGKAVARPRSYRFYSSLQLARNEDRLIDKHVTTRLLPKNDPPAGGGFGGSSTHRSSSGRSHGGGSRSFGGSSTHHSSSGRSHGGGSRKF
ncbi:MAG: TPM domain-containing protein [Oscillospiraceae bacterium]|nr:TPM domain-containing protein [Oscillospiraceae bacterium]